MLRKVAGPLIIKLENSKYNILNKPRTPQPFTALKNIDENIKILVIRMDRVPHIDQSGVYALENIIFELSKKNVKTVLTGLKEQPKQLIENIDIIPDLVPIEQVFPKVQDSFAWIARELEGESHS